jgi:uridine phosphorylase
MACINNQERIKAGLENIVKKDPDPAIRVAIEALRLLIKEDSLEN